MAYTKYSLTPSSNTAAPPDGAPEGMLPSAVNDTMRDMMAQIRDCGDGIRGGTYTMTAPVITGGSINGAAIGASSASTGAFTNLSYTGTLTGGTGVVNLGSGQFYKDASGNVGIGTSSPARSLDIRKAYTADTIVAQIGNTNNGNGATPVATIFDFTEANGTSVSRIASIYTQSLGTTNLTFGTYSGGSLAEKMRIDGSGNVGIGTSSPGQALDVYKNAVALIQVRGGAASGQGGGFYVRNAANTGSLCAFGDSANQVGGTPDAAASIFTSSGVPLLFTVSSTERMRISGAGDLNIATTGLSVAVRLAVAYAGGGTQYGMALQPITDTTTSIYFNNASGTNVGSISQTASVTTYNVTSDYRLKENVAPMTGALDTVAKLKPVTYKWKVDGSDGQGFIAHELQAVVPDCVTGEKDAVDADGKPKYQGIDTSFLVATLVSAIQEQQAMIETLTTRLNALEGK